MAIEKKTFRYYYWIVKAFIKKNIKLILLSFLLSTVAIISLTSVSPYLISTFFAKKQIIGLVGTYDIGSLPEEVLSKISNGLVVISPKGEVVPVLVDTWQQLDNGKEYRFHIRSGITWNNGDRFTSRGITYKFKDVDIEYPSDDTIVFKLKKSLPIFATYLTQPVTKYPLIGVAGLYTVDRIKSQAGEVSEIDLNPDKGGLTPLVYKFYDSETKLVNAYKLGEITQMSISKKNLADFFSTWKNTAVEKTVDYGKLLTLFYNMNNQTLKEKDIRQAIAMAISRDNFEALGQPATGPIPPISWAYNDQIKQIPYDPELSQKILTKAFATTKSAKLTISTYDEYLDTAEAIQKNFTEKNLKVKTDVLSFDKPQTFDLLLAYWRVPSDPDQYYFWHSTQTQGNITGYKNVKIDKLLEDGRSTTSLPERKKIYADFQKVIADDVPAFFLYYPYTYTISRK